MSPLGVSNLYLRQKKGPAPLAASLWPQWNINIPKSTRGPGTTCPLNLKLNTVRPIKLWNNGTGDCLN